MQSILVSDAAPQYGAMVLLMPASWVCVGQPISSIENMRRMASRLWASRLAFNDEGWVSLDRKIAAALTNMVTGETGREITQRSNTCLNNNTIARGRVLLAIVFRHYASGQSEQAMYDMNHLQSLVMKGDNLDAFHNTWNLVIRELSVEPEHTLL
jgi:hypothetical protein